MLSQQKLKEFRSLSHCSSNRRSPRNTNICTHGWRTFEQKLSPKKTPCWTGGQRIWFKMTYLGPSPYNPLIISSEFVNKNCCCCYSFIAGLEFARRGIHLKLQLRPKKKKKPQRIIIYCTFKSTWKRLWVICL